jgi:deoxyhypusine monooxygenase
VPAFSVESLKAVLIDESAPIAKRTRAVFLLRQIGTEAAIDALAAALDSPSVLLGHEVAFVLGQMQNPYIMPTLIRVLQDESYHPVVRHEAAEALGALADPSNIALLESLCNDASVEVAHTCQIAVERVRFIAAHPDWDATYKSGYHCIDPAPPADEDDVATLQRDMMDTTKTLFQRYRAMFKLRDLNTEPAVLALATGFADASPVLRHEIAYVFGQIAHPASAPSLKTVIADLAEHSMVRHEAAEALGAIASECGGPEDPAVLDALAVLKQFQTDADRVVAESCDVALDIHDYWTSDEVETALVETA